MDEREEILLKLFQQCTVRLDDVENCVQGTGFFVSQGTILSCAHVVEEVRTGGVIDVFWQGKKEKLSATVQQILPDPNIDLAILTLNDSPRSFSTSRNIEHHCVYFDRAEIKLKENLYTFGYPKDINEDYSYGDSATLEYEGISKKPDNVVFLKLKEGHIKEGFSGSPLLNLRTGGVCGIIVISRDTENDLGGRAIPAKVVFEHFPDLKSKNKKFHQENGKWITLLPNNRHSTHKNNYFEVENFIPGLWKECSPSIDGIMSLAIDPRNPKIIYAGTGRINNEPSKIYRSHDGGNSWWCIDSPNPGHSIDLLVIPDYDPCRIYAGTSNGLFVSTNQGISWSVNHKNQNQFFQHYVRCLALSPQIQFEITDVLYMSGGVSAGAVTAAISSTPESETGKFLYTSIDGGFSWEKVSIKSNITAVAISPKDSRVAYIAAEDGTAYKMLENNIEKPLSKPNDSCIFCLAVSPENIDHILVGTNQGLYTSKDSGDSWQIASEVGSIRIKSITFSQFDKNYIFTTTTSGVFQSTDNGASWQAINQGLICPDSVKTITTASDGTVYAVVFRNAKNSSNTVFAGVYKKTNDKDYWESINNEFFHPEKISGLILAVKNNSLLYVGTPMGIFRSQNGGESWKHISYFQDSHGNREDVWSVALQKRYSIDSVSSINFKGMFVSTDGTRSWQNKNEISNHSIFAGTTNGCIYKSIDEGASWEKIAELDGDKVYSLVIPSENSNVIYAGIEGGGIFRSRDNGDSWNSINNRLSDLGITCLHISDNKVLYTSTYNSSSGTVSFYRSTNEGNSWQTCCDGLPNFAILSIVSSYQASSLVIYVATDGGGVYKSLNGGNSWFAINEGLRNKEVIALALLPEDNCRLYAGTKDGVFKTIDGGIHWNILNNGFEQNHHINWLSLSPESKNLLYAATVEKTVFKILDAESKVGASHFFAKSSKIRQV